VITAVDSSVLIDVFGAHEKWLERSAGLLRRCLAEGTVVACEVVWAETAVIFRHEADFLDAMGMLGVAFSPIEQAAALRAGQTLKTYRKRARGRGERVVADFLIGAHALEQAGRLLTRDRDFYRDDFAGLKILDPSAQ